MKRLVKFLLILITILLLYFILFKVINIDEKIMKKIYPLKYSDLIEKYAQEYNVDSFICYAIIKSESNFNEKAKSHKNAIGLMQIMESTAIETAKKMDIKIEEEDLYNPELNIKIGIKYLSDLLTKYNNYKLAIIAYNAGIGNVDKWIADGIIKEDASDLENIPFEETRNYIKRILKDYKIYKSLYK